MYKLNFKIDPITNTLHTDFTAFGEQVGYAKLIQDGDYWGYEVTFP